MITDAMVEAAAKSDAAFDGRTFERMGRVDRERYLARCRAALEAADRAAWQPIETAPRDVTEVLGWWSCGTVDVVVYSIVAQRWALASGPLTDVPVYWRPLPTSPEAA